MSILIKGMDMPKDGELLCINIYPDGKVSINLDLNCKQVATAAHVPPHGRRGDLDNLEKRILEEGRNQAEYFCDRYHPVVMAYGDCLGKVRSAPTIIPAEEVE